MTSINQPESMVHEANIQEDTLFFPDSHSSAHSNDFDIMAREGRGQKWGGDTFLQKILLKIKFLSSLTISGPSKKRAENRHKAVGKPAPVAKIVTARSEEPRNKNINFLDYPQFLLLWHDENTF